MRRLETEMTCEECYFQDYSISKEPCASCNGYSRFVKKIRTRLEWLQGMNDKELACELSWIQQDAYAHGAGLHPAAFPDSIADWIAWLQGPVEEVHDDGID